MVGNSLREKRGPFFGASISQTILQNHGTDQFWSSSRPFHSHGAKLFRLLCNGFAGQGKSEQMNISVKATRSLKRSRQDHKITAAYVELKNMYRMLEAQSSKILHRDPVPFRTLYQETIDDARDINELERTESALDDLPVDSASTLGDKDDEDDQYNEEDNFSSNIVDAFLK